MKETRFIEQNKEKWREFEEGFQKSETDPEKLNRLFLQITDDLSYARTYYPNRSVRLYLNRLAQQVYGLVYSHRGKPVSTFKKFWTDELPQVMFQSRFSLASSFMLFTLAMLIGVWSSIHDPAFPAQILGDDYIQMTETYIESGDPMKVYKVSKGGDMFFRITTNNLQVAFYCFILGLTFGLGTSVFLLYNGIMVGAFQYFFVERGLFTESFLTIWVHGAMEISAIVIAGAAGFELGRSLLYPGTYSRLVSLRLGALNAVRIFLGIVPVIVLAGLFESYLTRHTDTPDWIRGLLVGGEFAFMLTYYVLYPWRKSKQGFSTTLRPDEVFPIQIPSINLHSLKKDSEAFAESFNLIRLHGSFTWWSILVASTLATTAIFVTLGFDGVSPALSAGKELRSYLHSFESPLRWIGWTAAFSIVFLSIARHARLLLQPENARHPMKLYLLFPLLVAAWILAFSVPSDGFILLVIPGYVLLVFILVYLVLQHVGSRAVSPFSVLGLQVGNTLLLLAGQAFIGFIFILLADSGITYFHLELLKWNLPFDPTLYEHVTKVMMVAILCFSFFTAITLFSYTWMLLYFSRMEIITARALKEKTDKQFA